MIKKRKKKKYIQTTEFYTIEIDDWGSDYHFGINNFPKDIHDGVYWEISRLIIVGRIISPELKNASKARIEIKEDPQLDDHWQPKPTIISAKAIGWMEIPRGDNTLIFYCSIPSRSLPFITLAIQSEKIRFASIFGTILKWRQGTVSSISLSTHTPEE